METILVSPGYLPSKIRCLRKPVSTPRSQRIADTQSPTRSCPEAIRLPSFDRYLSAGLMGLLAQTAQTAAAEHHAAIAACFDGAGSIAGNHHTVELEPHLCRSNARSHPASMGNLPLNHIASTWPHGPMASHHMSCCQANMVEAASPAQDRCSSCRPCHSLRTELRRILLVGTTHTTRRFLLPILLAQLLSPAGVAQPYLYRWAVAVRGHAPRVRRTISAAVGTEAGQVHPLDPPMDRPAKEHSPSRTRSPRPISRVPDQPLHPRTCLLHSGRGLATQLNLENQQLRTRRRKCLETIQISITTQSTNANNRKCAAVETEIPTPVTIAT